MKQKQNDKISSLKNNQESNLSIKGHHVNPVILEIPEEEKDEQSRNNSLIKKMMKDTNSNIHYSGGFKNVDNSKISSCINKSVYRPESHAYSEKEIMDEMGVGKSSLKPKYRDENGGVGLGNSSISLEQRLQILKKEREEKNYKILHPKDEYTMSELPSRFQQVVHVQSSLDVINLESIQAKLEAHRRKMKPIEDEYNESRGKVADPAARYGSNLKFNIDVDKEYGELKVEEGKIYEISKIRQEMTEEEMEIEQMWELKKRNNPKLAEYDAKYQQYLLEKDAKNIIGHTIRDKLFTWDKYIQPGHKKEKSKIKPKASHSNDKSRIQNSSNAKEDKSAQKVKEEFGPDGLVSIKDLKDVIATRDDKFIASYIFAQLDSDKVGFISKEEFHEYVLSQKHIINGYNIDTKWLFTDIDNFETKRKGMISKSELAVFLATLEKVNHPSLILKDKSSGSLNMSRTNEEKEREKKGIRCNFPSKKHIFEKLFKVLDFNDDNLIKRQEYIENIYLDADCIKILDSEVIRIHSIDKSIKYRQIIGFILDDYLKERNAKLKKSKEYITFTRFCEYFEIPQSLDLSRIEKSSLKKKKDDSTESQIYDLPDEYLLLFKDIYNTLPRIYQDYIITADFLQTALRDPQILAISDQLCRIESIETRVPLETIQTTLHRMQKECDEYSHWESLKLFFSRRGRPLDWDYELIQKKKELRNEKIKNNRSSLSKDKLRETQNYFQIADRLKNKSKQKIMKGPDRYTVPVPFDITDMKQKEKEDLWKLKRGEQQYEELKKEFKARPVNKQILESKPDLIMGKVVKNLSNEKDKRPEYKYEDYENDRIQRALKRAQQEFEKQQQIKKIKQKTEVKAFNIGVDLTKKYQDVIKEQNKKKRQKEQSKIKNKTTKPEISESLYPKDIKEEKNKKLKKIEENLKKVDEISKRKEQITKENKEQIKRKNQQTKRKAEEAKKVEQELEEERKKMQTQGLDFKPKIKKRKVDENEKQAIEEGKKEREERKRREAEQFLLNQEEKKKKRLAFEKKQQFLDIEGLEDEEIIEKLDEIDFQDLLVDEQSKKQYRKEFDNKNKVRKQIKERQLGLAGRERAAMEAEEKRMMEEKKRYKQRLQKNKTEKNGGSFSRITEKGEKSGRNQLDFHRSKALRRYRALMDDKKPQSQWDKYSQFNENV